ncbi:MAG: glucuronate isomerase [Oscillospiraceae bacterium]|nr:glucuronate isomerase [Oscillospiraceae bacterium]
MAKFLSADFLLQSDTAKTLYHEFASKMPIFDYHCHIDPKEIFEDRRFENITQVWLGGDHYKWRVMRSNGVSEEFITGSASDREKFQKFAEALPRCIGNPMYHWCHLELKNYFGYEGVLNGETAQEVWELTGRKLREDSSMSARGLILKSNVAMVGTTDDPCSDLEWHKKIAATDFPVKVCPSFRPDPAVNIHKAGFVDYIAKLSAASGVEIASAADVKKALSQRIDYFNENGCRASDHGLDYVMFRLGTDEEIETVFAKAMRGETVTTAEAEIYQTAMLLHCGRQYARHGWVMQLHFSCLRNTNSRMFATLGADTGFDCIAVTDSSAALSSLLNALDSENALPKTILYSLNPADDQWLDTFLGAFQSDEIPGKIQHGSAWWFNDNKTGMINQLTSLANLSILGNFIGMLTDSRSFLSYARHEYFRRILCNLIGTWVENGEYPDDIPFLGSLVEDICANNAKRYFGL